MELIDGVDFQTVHVRAGNASPADSLSALQISRLRGALVQLAQGVQAIHRAGKLHRDIKPSNVLVQRDGRVVLLDFGLAAALNVSGNYQSTEQHVVGTFAYMAPEQAASETVSPACDWYSVGVMLFQALTNRLPFVGTPVEILLRKQQQESQWPTDVEAPDDLVQLCRN